MTKGQLIEVIKASGKIDNADAAMHADAIVAGEYTLAVLLENAAHFYTFDGYAHDDMLMDSM